MLSLFIAVSLDGKIARADGNIDWLTAFDRHLPGEDYGYSAFLAGVGALVMGGVTYRHVLTFGQWPYPGLPCVVLTHRPLGVPPDAAVTAFDGDVRDAVAQLSVVTDRAIWLVGGGDIVRQCMEHDLIDEYRITVMPLTLGEGLPLFPGPFPMRRLTLVNATTYPNGVVTLTYRRAADEGDR